VSSHDKNSILEKAIYNLKVYFIAGIEVQVNASHISLS
jgi:hypothetical protein